MSRLEELTSDFAVSHVRQADWFDPANHPEAHVTMIGAGGIGSPTALCVSKLGVPYLTIVDFDEVEYHNIPNQFYALHHDGVKKAEALAAMCMAFGTPEVNVLDGRAEDFPEAFHGVVITGLDNMDARAAVWEKCKNNPDVELLIDGRLGGQDIVVLSIDPNDPDQIEYYETYYLFPQSEAVEAPCTARGVIDVSFQVASLITRNVRRHFENQPVEHTITFSQEALVMDKSGSFTKKEELVDALDSIIME